MKKYYWCRISRYHPTHKDMGDWSGVIYYHPFERMQALAMAYAGEGVVLFMVNWKKITKAEFDLYNKIS